MYVERIEREAVKTFGKISQIDKFIEEASELTKALLKERYKEGSLKPEENIHIAEEMADVEIMLEQLKIIFNNADRVDGWKESKLERLERRIAERKGELQ